MSFKRIFLACVIVSGLVLAFMSIVQADPDRPVQAKAPTPYEAGVMRMAVVDHDSPFDILHGIEVGPRILVGEVFYPIEPGSGGETPINLSYYYDSVDAYARLVAGWFGVPPAFADMVLSNFGTSLAEHLATPREGIYADTPIAEGVFPLLLLFHGSAMRAHQTDDLPREYAERGYVVVALDAPGVSPLTPVGRAMEPGFTELGTALGSLPPCFDPLFASGICFDPVNGEYGSPDGGGLVWMAPYLMEQYVIQRAYDGVAMIEEVKAVFPDHVDDTKVGVVGVSLGGPPTFMAPKLIDALRSMPDARYVGYGVVPSPMTLRSIGLDDGNGGLFGEAMGDIICQGDPSCDPFNAASSMNQPIGFGVAQEDGNIFNRENFLYSIPWWLGYGPDLSEEPSLSNKFPANRDVFESVVDGVPSIWVELPDSQHLDETTDPLFSLFDMFFMPDNRLVTGEPFTPLEIDTQIEIIAHYSLGFFDLTLKGKRGSLGALKTGRYNNVTEDGRGVIVEAKSLEVPLHH
jgi:hypothetical protein